MDFAADAVFDVIAPPPPRAAGPKAAPTDDGPTFADRLDAELQAAPDEPARADAKAKDEHSTDAPKATDDGDESVAVAPPAPQDAAPPIVVQMIASAPPALAAPVEAAPTKEISAPQAAAPVDAAEPAQAPVASPQPEAAPKQEASDAADDAPIAAKPADTQVKSDAPQQAAAPAPQVAPVAPPAAAAQPSTEQVEQVAAETPAPVMSAQAAPVREPAMRAAKSDAPRGEAKTEAAKALEPKDGAPEQPDTPKAEQKSAPAGAGAKDFSAPQTTINTGDAAAPSLQIASPQAPAQTSAQVQHASTDQIARTAPAASQVAHEIVRRFNGQNTEFNLRLDPPELGRVDVRLEVSRDHRVTAVVSADNPQALTELARHARDLEQTLQSAGLELSENGLTFDLRQGREGGEGAGRESNGKNGGSQGEEPQQQTAQAARPLGFERWRGVRVDMMV